MLSVTSMQAFNLKKDNRVTRWSTMPGANGTVLPVATVAFVIYVAGAQSQILLEFRGQTMLDRLKVHFSNPMTNAMNISGHLVASHLPSAGEKHEYGVMLVAVENSQHLTYTGIMTTVIVVDSFESSIGINPQAMRDNAALSGTPVPEMVGTPQFIGLVSINSAIANDGPTYVFGKSVARNDPNKVRYSVSGVARHGRDSGKVRVEIHGAPRVEMFQGLVARNNAMFVQGNLVVYAGKTPGEVTFAVWVSQFQAINLGSVESMNGAVMGMVQMDGVDVPVVPSAYEEWDLVYSDITTPQFVTADDGDDLPF